jgi:hypothetical protein
MIEYLGWAATAVFVSSYFSARAETLKRIQMLGALMWMAYGFVIGALPVVVANVLVFAAAAWSGARADANAPTTLPSDARSCCLPPAPSPPRALPGTSS